MLSYKITGRGKPILLIHGFGISFNIWRKIAPILKTKYKLIIIELPGIGKSGGINNDKNYYEFCSNEIENLRKSLKIKKWNVISYSVGARAAEIYIKKYGKQVDRAIFIFPLFINKNKANTVRRLINFDKHFPIFGNWLLSGWRLQLLIILIGFNGRIDKEAKNWHYQISSQPISTLRITLRDLPGFGEAKFNLSAVPLLFIWGKHDFIPERPHMHPVDAFIKTGHYGIVTHAKEISEAIFYFLK